MTSPIRSVTAESHDGSARRRRRGPGRPAALLLAAALAAHPIPALAGPRPLALRHVPLDLPGPPANILHADLDGDGRQDLAIVIARTQWGEIGTDRIEGMMQISEVVPALFDRREVRAYRQEEDGSYKQAGEPLPLPPSVISLEAGPPGIPIAVLTDEGVSALRLDSNPAHGTETPPDGSGAGADPSAAGASPAGAADTGAARSETTTSGPALVLTPLITDRPVLAGSKSLVSRLDMIRDLDGDGTWDLLLPARDGAAVYMTSAGTLGTNPVARLKLPGDKASSGTHPVRNYPRPVLGDLDGDGTPDLLVQNQGKGKPGTRVEVMRGEGGGRFGALQTIAIDTLDKEAQTPVTPQAGGGKSRKNRDRETEIADDAGFRYFGDLTGDGLAEAVFVSEIDTDKGGLKEAKEPEFEYRFHHADKNLVIQPKPYQKLHVKGFGFSIDVGDIHFEEFLDLDGDRRKDLVTVTLDFSLFQLVRIMATKRISIGLDFHVWNQGSDGVFAPVSGLDLSETLRMDLNNLKLGSLAQFAGDFDGDGKTDFVHLGRGKEVTIHRGQAGCRYAPKADLTVPFEEEPGDVSLVRIGDFDGDGRSDLGLIRPLDTKGASRKTGEGPDPDVTSPVRLDLYLSRGGR